MNRGFALLLLAVSPAAAHRRFQRTSPLATPPRAIDWPVFGGSARRSHAT